MNFRLNTKKFKLNVNRLFLALFSSEKDADVFATLYTLSRITSHYITQYNE